MDVDCSGVDGFTLALINTKLICYNAVTFHLSDQTTNLQLIRKWCIFAPKEFMNRQSITFTKPNDEWLRSMVESQEYSSKSELVNDLIRQARGQQAELDWIRRKLEEAESSGFTDSTKDEILRESKMRSSRDV